MLRAKGPTALLEHDAAWARSHPRTTYLLREEAESWRRAGPLQLTLPG